MLTFDRIKPELVCPWWLPRWMARCKLPLHPRNRCIHGSGEARTHWGGHERKEDEQARVREGHIRDLEGHARVTE
jgi:hypothetical protein